MSADLIRPDRLPPQSREAEMNVLGSMLRDPEVIDDVMAVAPPRDFYFDAHQKVFTAILALRETNRPVELPSVFAWLCEAKWKEGVGGAEYLAELWDSAPTAANAGYYARIVRDKAVGRRLIHACTETLREAYDGAMPTAELVAQAEQRVFDLSTGAAPDGPVEWDDYIDAARRQIDDRTAAGGAKPRFVPTGFASLDNLLGGFYAESLYVIGAAPGCGKTAVTLAFLAAAARAGTPGLLHALEMSGEELGERGLAMTAGVPLNWIRGTGHLPDWAAERVASAPGVGRVWIDDAPDVTAAAIASATRRMVSRHRVGIVAVDYLQLIAADAAGRENRNLAVGDNTRRMKLLARACKVPVLLACQLNRKHDDYTRPTLQSLRDSGEIGQHPDCVIFLWRDEPPPNGAEEEAINVTVAKQRNGPTGEIRLTFRRPCVRFEDRVMGLD